MTFDQVLLFCILGLALAFFIWGRLRYDLVAVLALLVAVVVGVVPANQAFAGFGHPAVITVAAILVLSRCLRSSGIVDTVARPLQRLSKAPTWQILSITSLTAFCSGFMNNVGALALMLPVALKVADRARRSASQYLMPISFASLLGGLTTLIGTPPNIIIAEIRAEAVGEPFSLFDFTPVGLTIAIAGVAFIGLIGWRLLPQRTASTEEIGAQFDIGDYITEVRIPPNSPFVGRRVTDLESLAGGDAAIVAMERRGDRMLAPSAYLRLQAGDVLIFEADTAAIDRIVTEADLDNVGTADFSEINLRSERVGLTEAVITPGSRLEGGTAQSLSLHTRFGVNLLGIARQGHTIHDRLGRVRLTIGDVLLLQGERRTLPETLSALGCLPLAGREIAIRPRKNRYLVLGVFAAALLVVAFGLAAPAIAFVGAVAALVITRSIDLQEVYEAIDWPVVILLGALIPVGMALETTGGSEIVATPILAAADYVPIWAVLALLMFVTMLLSDVMNNAATAVLMAPIGITIALGLDANIDPFLMAVAIGSSSTYLTPVGHQSNLLVMGPGGYRFGDYWRLGIFLDVIVIAVAVPMIQLVWPL